MTTHRSIIWPENEGKLVYFCTGEYVLLGSMKEMAANDGGHGSFAWGEVVVCTGFAQGEVVRSVGSQQVKWCEVMEVLSRGDGWFKAVAMAAS